MTIDAYTEGNGQDATPLELALVSRCQHTLTSDSEDAIGVHGLPPHAVQEEPFLPPSVFLRYDHPLMGRVPQQSCPRGADTSIDTSLKIRIASLTMRSPLSTKQCKTGR